MTNKIEAICDAIFKVNGGLNPDSTCYKLKNPLLLQSFAPLGKHSITDEGTRVFASFLAGYKSACFDVDLKIRGKSRAGLKPTDTLESLLRVYKIQSKAALDSIVSFLRRALENQQITLSTQLSYFIETKSEPKASE